MNIFLSGGCKNGKSLFAQKLAYDYAVKHELPLYYVATMISADSEDDARIKRHREERRGWGFETIEKGVDICECLNDPMVDKKGVFLFDSVTALFGNEMLTRGEIRADAKEKTARDLCNFAEMTGNTIFVSDFIYSDSEKFDDISLAYIEGLAYIDRRVSAICEEIIEYAYGVPFYHKMEGR